MTGLLLNLFLLTSYHQSYDYTPKTFEIVRQLSLLSVEKLDTTDCELDMNYYADENYFAFGQDCKEGKRIVVIDIKKMSFKRIREKNFFCGK